MRLANIYLAYLVDAQLRDGRFHNFMGYDRRWLDRVGTHDSVGRALWALGYGMRYAPRATWRRVSERLFAKGLESLEWLRFPRSQAYTIIGLVHALEGSEATAAREEYRAALRRLADLLKGRYDALRQRPFGAAQGDNDPSTRTGQGDKGPSTRRSAAAQDDNGEDWVWFEDAMTYDNARLPEAMLRAGTTLHDNELTAVGLRTLQFYVRHDDRKRDVRADWQSRLVRTRRNAGALCGAAFGSRGARRRGPGGAGCDRRRRVVQDGANRHGVVLREQPSWRRDGARGRLPGRLRRK